MATIFKKKCTIIINEGNVEKVCRELENQKLNSDLNVRHSDSDNSTKWLIEFYANRKQYDKVMDNLKAGNIGVWFETKDTFGRTIYQKL